MADQRLQLLERGGVIGGSSAGATIQELTGHDPAIPAGTRAAGPVRIVDDAYSVADDASALVVLTEWPQFLIGFGNTMNPSSGARSAVPSTRVPISSPRRTG